MVGSDPDSDSYGRRKPQIRKGDLYMFTALWMQESPWRMKPKRQDLNVVGSVFVLPNDRVLSADCTRQLTDHNIPIHGAIRPIIKYPDKVKDCEVYLTRKPCANCVKMLVQAGVSKVFYLPLQPEKPKEKDENKSVDALFQVSEVSKSFYVPNISQQHIVELENQEAPYGKNTTNSTDTFIEYFKEEQKWNESWISKLKEDLDWQEFGDEDIKKQVEADMKNAFKWFCQATFATGEKDEMAWEQIGKPWGEPYDQKEVTHLSRLAQMLSNRTDDPNRGVGCVIVDGKEIVSIGWNGFPSKALYGNHPRGSDKDNPAKPKYPHIIYAAQNALLSRNERNIENSVVYINITPGDECMSILYEQGVERLVVPSPRDEKRDKNLKPCFYALLEKDKIRVLKHQTETVTASQSTE